MKKAMKILRAPVMCFLMMSIICGVFYTAAVTGVAQTLFHDKANGSTIEVKLKDGTKRNYGSELIAQEFTKKDYLIGRPTGSSNLSPMSKEHKDVVESRVEWWHKFDPDNKKDLPSDLVNSSGSGVDPMISPESAEYQVSRIAKSRGISKEEVRNTIDKYTTKRLLGFLGEPSVNVLKVNLDLDGLI